MYDKKKKNLEQPEPGERTKQGWARLKDDFDRMMGRVSRDDNDGPEERGNLN